MKIIAPLLLSLAVITASAAENKTSAYTIDQCVNTFDSAKSKKTKAGSEYWFADRDFADLTTVKLSVVGVGQATHAPHRHVEDEFFFILEGKAEFYLDGERRVAGPMTSLYAPSNREHGIRNAGDTELRYLVLKKYADKK
ncbi:cupin domain-containing protein [Oleiharenicola lentus]|uniref:cupin domain-containing protein n=1 Tax=Oleiharenicola lentus TaxID=2508720 RepID=UPI003F681812